MAKINVTGDMIQIKTNITESEYDVVSHYSPNTLKIIDKDGNEVFGITKGDAHCSQYGVAFCSADSEGKMFMSCNNPVEDHSDPVQERKLIAKEFAQVINNLQIIETQVANEKPNITALVQKASDAICITDEACHCENESCCE